MPEAITDLSPEAVIEAIEGNLVDSSAALGRTEEGVVFRGSDVTWVYTGFQGLSRVLKARFNNEEAEDRIAEILSYFKHWDASVMWVVGPTSFPPKLGEYLHTNGFGAQEVWSGMARDLTTLTNSIAQPDSLQIKVAADEPSLRTWAMLSSGEGPVNGDAEASLNVFSRDNAGGDSRCRYYLGYVNGVAIARGMSFTRGKAVGLYWINTLSEFRGRGIGAAMAQRAMQDARAAGATVAVMPVPPGAEAMCVQLGFKPYCQFHVYAWPPSPLRMPMC